MSVKYEDYYQVLGVGRDATAKEIQAAFRKLARKYHPDVNKEPDAEKNFKKVNEAYEVLKDPDKRKRYDQLGADWQAGQDFTAPPGWENVHVHYGDGSGNFHFDSGGDFSDFFEMFFGGQGRGFGDYGSRSAGTYKRNWSQKGQDQESELTITLEDAYFGGSKTVGLRVLEESSGGQGIGSRKEINVKIPKGIRDGSRIRLKGQGGPGINGGPAGDLYFKINIAPHASFTWEGQDLKTMISVSPWQAILGDKVQVPTLDGRVSIKIPAGTQSGQRFRLKGKGLPRGQAKGDLYGIIHIQIPKNLSEKELQLVKQLAGRQDAAGTEQEGS